MSEHLLHTHEDLSSDPSTYIKGQVWPHTCLELSAVSGRSWRVGKMIGTNHVPGECLKQGFSCCNESP